MRGRLVTFEGIDGSGKSATLKRIVPDLRATGLRVWATREETEGPSGEWVRRSIAEGWPPLSTAFLFAADRARHLADVEARRAAGEHVLCDRFLHSMLAYQSVTLRGAVPDPVGFLRRLHDGWCPMPDKVLLFDSDPRKSLERTKGRAAAAPYEKLAFLQQVRANYLALAKEEPERFTVLDADQPIDGLARDALAAVRKALA